MTPAPTTADTRLSRYARMNGIGNAILVVDRRGQAALDGRQARALHGRPRLAFDQLMMLGDPRTPDTDAYVEIFNADGSRAGACGNGTRCVAWFLMEGTGRTTATVETEAGLLACRRDAPWAFTVDMGAPRFGWREIPLARPVDDTLSFALTPTETGLDALGPCAALSMGNPHAVFFAAPDAPRPDPSAWGPRLEDHAMFPARANISFARVLTPTHAVLDVWERGAGLTRACGSAACAALVAGVRRGLLARRAEVTLPGGTLSLLWREADDHVLMSGPVELEEAGELLP